jgi:hypothetical protein
MWRRRPRFRSAVAYLAAPTGLGYSASIEFPGTGGADEHLPSTARIPRRTRRRGGLLAALGARKAGRPRAAHRRQLFVAAPPVSKWKFAFT